MKLEEQKELQVNQTGKYLSAVLNGLPKKELEYIIQNKDSIRCYAINDVHYQIAYKLEEVRYLMFLVIDPYGKWLERKKLYEDPTLSKNKYKNFIRFFRKSTYYVDDYKLNHLKHQYNVLVIGLPDKWKPVYDAFVESKYSQMFDGFLFKECQINRFKDKPNLKQKYSVFTKDPTYKKIFESILNKTFGTNITIDDDRELDFPIKLQDEILNYEDLGSII